MFINYFFNPTFSPPLHSCQIVKFKAWTRTLQPIQLQQRRGFWIFWLEDYRSPDAFNGQVKSLDESEILTEPDRRKQERRERHRQRSIPQNCCAAKVHVTLIFIICMPFWKATLPLSHFTGFMTLWCTDVRGTEMGELLRQRVVWSPLNLQVVMIFLSLSSVLYVRICLCTVGSHRPPTRMKYFEKY